MFYTQIFFFTYNFSLHLRTRFFLSKQVTGWFVRAAVRIERHEKLKQSILARFKEVVNVPYVENNLATTAVQLLSELIDQRFTS